MGQWQGRAGLGPGKGWGRGSTGQAVCRCQKGSLFSFLYRQMKDKGYRASRLTENFRTSLEILSLNCNSGTFVTCVEERRPYSSNR